jgi:hypothetical protein
MMSAASLARATFRASRLLDFCSPRELIKQIGHGVDKWPLVVLKELTDNAIDAAEEAGIAPMIRIEVSDNEIIIADNGPGIPAETVAVRVSSREAYASPTRGVHGKRTQALFDWAQSVLAQLGLVEAISPFVHADYSAHQSTSFPQAHQVLVATSAMSVGGPPSSNDGRTSG